MRVYINLIRILSFLSPRLKKNFDFRRFNFHFAMTNKPYISLLEGDGIKNFRFYGVAYFLNGSLPMVENISRPQNEIVGMSNGTRNWGDVCVGTSEPEGWPGPVHARWAHAKVNWIHHTCFVLICTVAPLEHKSARYQFCRQSGLIPYPFLAKLTFLFASVLASYSVIFFNLVEIMPWSYYKPFLGAGE